MSRKNRNRYIPPQSLQTPERGAPPLETPEEASLVEGTREEEEADDEPERQGVDTVLEKPVLMTVGEAGSHRVQVTPRRARIDPARVPRPVGMHWGRAWETGRDAAIEALSGGATPKAVAATTAPMAVGCRDCWTRGRDAVLKVIQGE